MRTAARRFQLGLTCVLLLVGGLPMHPELPELQRIEHVRNVAPALLQTSSISKREPAARTVTLTPVLVTQLWPNRSRLYLQLRTLLL